MRPVRQTVIPGAVLLLAVAGCTSAPADDPGPLGIDVEGPTPRPEPGRVDACGDLRITPLVYNGTRGASYVPLASEQALSIGLLEVGGGICTGTLIAPLWVLTAKHCTDGVSPLAARFRSGTDPNNPNVAISVSRIANHPTADLALLELSEDGTSALHGAIPIRLLTERMDSSWIGRKAEAAGFGETETGEIGTRRFTAEPISSFPGDLMEINGEGRHGVCFGDSGGPALVIASDGTTRVAGALSAGEGSCTGRDNFARVDLYRTWIEEHAGATPDSDAAGCGTVGREGRCASGTALWCEQGAVTSEACGDGTTCAWDTDAFGYRCVAAESDPCAGVTSAGACDGNAAQWCDRGVLRTRNCGSCGETCQFVEDLDGFYCAPDPCAGVDYRGRCSGSVAEWCENGVLERKDCGAAQKSCGWVDEQTGYYCQ